MEDVESCDDSIAFNNNDVDSLGKVWFLQIILLASVNKWNKLIN